MPACSEKPEFSATSRRGASGSAGSVCSVNTFWPSRGPVAIRYVIEAVHADHSEAPRLLTGASAQAVWSVRLEAYGSAVVDDDPDSNSVSIGFNFRFPGQPFDTESGLHYIYHRVYSPETGRYLEYDPIGLAVESNPYAYASNNPLRYIDAEGLFPSPGSVYAKILCEVVAAATDERSRAYDRRIRDIWLEWREAEGRALRNRIWNECQPLT